MQASEPVPAALSPLSAPGADIADPRGRRAPAPRRAPVLLRFEPDGAPGRAAPDGLKDAARLVAPGAARARVGFLLNHEAAHQVAHALPIALALARLRPDIEVEVFFSAGVEDEVRRLAGAGGEALKLTQLRGAGAVSALASRASGDAVPFERVAMLRNNAALFARLSALVVPDTTPLLLKTRFGLSDLKIVYCSHGAGDRAIGFDRSIGKFDFVLLSGRKYKDRLEEAGLLRPGGFAVTGYAKFDLLAQAGPARPLFSNDRPTVLYNPHPSPALSSWYRMGRAILRYFAQSEDYNLIFAPHVMLYRKRLNISLAPFSAAWVRRVEPSIARLDHVHVDTGGRESIDMSHVRRADIYLGDASSQVYEFLTRPRPCVFVNAAGRDWRRDPNFAHWGAGPVVDRVEALGEALAAAQADHPATWAARQRALFSYTFDLAPTPSSERGARAVAAWLDA